MTFETKMWLLLVVAFCVMLVAAVLGVGGDSRLVCQTRTVVGVDAMLGNVVVVPTVDCASVPKDPQTTQLR